MGRRRRASLWSQTGKRMDRGRELPGFYVRYSEYGPDGARIHRSEHFDTLKNAKTFVRRFNAKHDLGLIGHIIPIGVREAALEFIGACEALSRDTCVQYQAAITFLRLVVQDRDVSTITGADIDRFTAERIRESSHPTAAKHLRGLNRFFVWAVEKGYIAENPVKKATARPRTAGVRNRPSITDEELAKIVKACDTEDRRIAVWIAMTSGLDLDVIRNLSAHQIDFANKKIRIVRPKTGRELTVPLHHSVLPFLAERMRQRGPSVPLLDGIHERKWWRQTLRRAGAPQALWFRDLRAVASSWLQRVVGLSLTDVQKLLGHSSPMVTARHYSDLHPDVEQRFHVSQLPGHEEARAEKKEKRAPSRGS